MFRSIRLKKMERINFDNQYKVRISNPDDSMRKHDVVKTLIVMELMYRTRKKKKYHIIYTEYPVGSRKFDVYHHDLLSDKIIVYEIQKKVSTSWKKKLYNSLSDDVDLQIVFLSDLPDDINKLNKEVKELVLV